MELKKGYKQTDAGVIPSDWSEKTFKDICWVNQGLQIPISKRLTYPSKNSKIYITIQYLNDGKIVEYINDYVQSVCCNKDDILMTRTGNTGIVVSGVDGVFHNNFFKINFNREQIDKNYLIYYLTQAKTKKIILTKAGTSTIPDLNHKDFYSIPIPLPPTKSEQTAIATALSDVDALLTSLEKLIAKKRNIKQGVMQKLLAPKKGWEVKKLDEICSVIRGASPRPQGDKRYYGGQVPRLMVEDVTRDGKYVIPQVDFLTEEGAKRSRPCKKGTLTLVCSGTVGIPSILAVDACIHDGFLALININKNYSTDFLYHKFVTLQSELDNSATHGGIFTNLTTSSIKEFEVQFPSIDEQNHIASILSNMDDEINQLAKKLSKVKKVKLGMMQNLLTGKIRLV